MTLTWHTESHREISEADLLHLAFVRKRHSPQCHFALEHMRRQDEGCGRTQDEGRRTLSVATNATTERDRTDERRQRTYRRSASYRTLHAHVSYGHEYGARNGKTNGRSFDGHAAPSRIFFSFICLCGWHFADGLLRFFVIFAGTSFGRGASLSLSLALSSLWRFGRSNRSVHKRMRIAASADSVIVDWNLYCMCDVAERAIISRSCLLACS